MRTASSNESKSTLASNVNQSTDGCIFRAGAVAVVVFNTAFALLAIVTLAGIVFITQPKQVMHQLPPEAWLPLLVVMSPALLFAQYLSWRTVFGGETPTALAIARRQPPVPWMLKPAVCIVWLWNFVIGCIIVISLSEPIPGRRDSVPDSLLILCLSLLLTFPANLYLLLATKTITDNDDILRKVWRNRLTLDLILLLVAMLYYQALR